MKSVPHLDINPFDERVLSDPYSYHSPMRDAGSVFWLPAIGAYGIARYAEVKSVLADHETFCSGRGVGLSDFTKEPPFRPPSLLLEADLPSMSGRAAS